jgi:hypothetical protein
MAQRPIARTAPPEKRLRCGAQSACELFGASVTVAGRLLANIGIALTVGSSQVRAWLDAEPQRTSRRESRRTPRISGVANDLTSNHERFASRPPLHAFVRQRPHRRLLEASHAVSLYLSRWVLPRQIELAQVSLRQSKQPDVLHPQVPAGGRQLRTHHAQ